MNKIQSIIGHLKSKPIYYMPLGYIVIALLAISPIIIAMFAGFCGDCLGCHINEAGTDKCIRWGIPFGIVLNTLGIMGWFAIITIPPWGNCNSWMDHLLCYYYNSRNEKQKIKH